LAILRDSRPALRLSGGYEVLLLAEVVADFLGVVGASKVLAHQGGLKVQLVVSTPAVSKPSIQP